MRLTSCRRTGDLHDLCLGFRSRAVGLWLKAVLIPEQSWKVNGRPYRLRLQYNIPSEPDPPNPKLYVMLGAKQLRL